MTMFTSRPKNATIAREAVVEHDKAENEHETGEPAKMPLRMESVPKVGETLRVSSTSTGTRSGFSSALGKISGFLVR